MLGLCLYRLTPLPITLSDLKRHSNTFTPPREGCSVDLVICESDQHVCGFWSVRHHLRNCIVQLHQFLSMLLVLVALSSNGVANCDAFRTSGFVDDIMTIQQWSPCNVCRLLCTCEIPAACLLLVASCPRRSLTSDIKTGRVLCARMMGQSMRCYCTITLFTVR